ncbi:MAG: histidine kinase N-terminal 7TM domain-containing protein [Verrucomicrobiota bacterium]
MHTYLLYLTAAFYAVLACVTFARKRTPITMFFGIMLILSGIWAATYAAELDAHELAGKIRWMKFRLIFIPYLGTAWLAFALAVTGMQKTFKRWCWLIILLFPSITATLALTGWKAEWLRYDFSIEHLHGLQILTYSSGQWCCIHKLTLHATGLLGTFILLSAWHSTNPLHRKQFIILTAAYLFPTLGNIVSTSKLLPFHGIKPAPFFLIPSMILLTYVVSRHRMLDLVPIARSMLLDHINDGLIVVDTFGLIVDINTAAESRIGVRGMDALGTPIKHLPPPWNNCLDGVCDDEESFKIETGGEQYWFTRKRIPIQDSAAKHSGTLILIRDTTVENQYRQRESELKQMQVQKHLLRDIHDGLGGIITNIAFMSAIARNEQKIQKKDEWLDKLQLLTGEANVEIRELMNSLECNTMGWPDVINAIRRVSNVMFDNRIIDLRVRVEGMPPDEEPGILAGLSIIRMAKESMNNIVKHASADQVDIGLSFTADLFRLIVLDNGCGFDPATIQSGCGLGNLGKRAGELRGSLHIDTSHGTQIRISIPLPICNIADSTSHSEEPAP